jgi:hypothetical protein
MATIATGASNGVYVAKVKNKYVLVSTEFSISCDGGTHIYTATSDSITGPFTANKALYTITDNDLGHTPFFYGPSIHPEYINSKNEILITYDINCYTSCEPSCINNGFNPDYYRPRGLRVPLVLIDSSLAEDAPAAVIVNKGKNGWRLLAYPNPTHSCFTLTLQGCTERQVDVRLLSLLGTTVYHEQLPVNGATITQMITVPGGISKGVYFLVVQGETSTQFDKILLQ